MEDEARKDEVVKVTGEDARAWRLGGPASALAGGIISVDDHLIEPPDLWSNRLSGAAAELAPRFGHDGTRWAWKYEGVEMPIPRFVATMLGQPGSPVDPVGFGDFDASCWSPHVRVGLMDQLGVSASLVMPTICGLGGETFLKARDKATALACLDAYNSYVLEEWHGQYPGRFIPAAILPLWDVARSAWYVGHLAKHGFRAVLIPQDMSVYGLPPIWSAHWRPLLDAIAEADMAAVVHLYSGGMPVDPAAPLWVQTCNLKGAGLFTLADWLFSDIFLHTPGLRVCFAEMGIGWARWLVDMGQADIVRYRRILPTQPSEDRERRFRENVGIVMLDESVAYDPLLADTMMLGWDWPHLDSTGLGVVSSAVLNLSAYDHREVTKIARGNAARFFRFDAEASE